MTLRLVAPGAIDPASAVIVTPNNPGGIVERLCSRGLKTVLAARDLR